jgi:hypothetical protein
MSIKRFNNRILTFKAEFFKVTNVLKISYQRDLVHQTQNTSILRMCLRIWAERILDCNFIPHYKTTKTFIVPLQEPTIRTGTRESKRLLIR